MQASADERAPAHAPQTVDDTQAWEGNRVRALVDGRVAMLTMARAFLSARQYILLAGWDLRADLVLVRGTDARAGADGSEEQRALENSLRADGLDDAAIALWTTGNMRVCDALGFASGRGARVGVLLWDAYHIATHVTNDPAEQRDILVGVGVDCLLDDSSRSVRHIAQSLHQKCAVVDGRVAFVGGVDLTCQEMGDYDRWDTHYHPCSSPVRAHAHHAEAHPWHDLHTVLHGPIVADVQHNIAQRWADVAQRHGGDDWPARLPLPERTAIPGGERARAIRTIPRATYAFAPEGIRTIHRAYLEAVRAARTFIYIENQYLWPAVFLGFDNERWGMRCEQTCELLDALGDALARGVHVGLLLPDHPNCGRRFSDAGIAHLLERAPRAEADGLLHVFTLGNSEPASDAPGEIRYRPVYVHAKVAIVDDAWWTAGSANVNNRGMRDDAEMNVEVWDAEGARALRLGLWEEHAELGTGTMEGLVDPIAGMRLLDTVARANLDAVGARRPLRGHVLPYLRHDDAGAPLPVDPEHGLLDNIPGGAGGHSAKYAGRYI